MKNTREEYAWQGFLIITILMIIGFAMIYFTWGKNEINYENIYNYISVNGAILIFSSFFIGIGFYCWKKYFTNAILKPQKKVLYLANINDNLYTFVDSKGKKYMYTFNDNVLLNNGIYYNVMKTKDYIKEIIGISDEFFSIKTGKFNFWSNWYTPMGHFENVIILPLLYVLFLPGFLSFLISKGFDKIYGLIFMIIPGIFIIYDIVYKIKKNSNSMDQNFELKQINTDSELMNSKLKKSLSLPLMRPIFQFIEGLLFLGGCGWIFIKSDNNTMRMVIIPFLICALSILIGAVILLLETINEVKTPQENKNNSEYKNKKMLYHNFSNFFSKLYIIGFLLFWFGFLIVGCYIIIREQSYSMLLFSIPFWIAGIFIVYKKFKK